MLNYEYIASATNDVVVLCCWMKQAAVALGPIYRAEACDAIMRIFLKYSDLFNNLAPTSRLRLVRFQRITCKHGCLR